MTKEQITEYFKLFTNPDPECDGLERFLSINGKDEVFERLKEDGNINLNKVQLNQLLAYSGLTNISFGFFKYYWLTLPVGEHPYDIEKIEGYEEDFDETFFAVTNERGYVLLEDEAGRRIFRDLEGRLLYQDAEGKYAPVDSSVDIAKFNVIPNTEIKTLKHLRWGLRRIYVDCLLYYGNITLGFGELNNKDWKELTAYFKSKLFDTRKIKARGHSLKFLPIDENDRYLISEMACKNLDTENGKESNLRKVMLERYKEAKEAGINSIKVGVLLDKDKNIDKRRKDVRDVKKALKEKTIELELDIEITTSDILEDVINSEQDIDKILTVLITRFNAAREKALKNTKLFLSLVNDMDVYVATSMRTKDDFLVMAKNCFQIFKGDADIKEMNIRYFDPTISAAEGHDDKGIIECLMVRCAKVLIYTSGDKDSYGKDAEAAMALSSGKPVIFLCDKEIREQIFKEVHPLAKLIDFETGVANGAMIAKNIQEVIVLLKRLFNNSMQYKLEKKTNVVVNDSTGKKIEKAHFKLIDTLTMSTVRVQTSDLLLSKSFWNYYTRSVQE